MKLALFGTKAHSFRVRHLVEKYGHTIIAYVNAHSQDKIGTVVDGLPVISIREAGERYRKSEIEGVLLSSAYAHQSVVEMVRYCKEQGIGDQALFITNSTVYFSGKPDANGVISLFKDCIQINDLNIHLVDRCNLNCELCCHSSQFAENDPWNWDTAEYEKDMRRLHELVPNRG